MAAVTATGIEGATMKLSTFLSCHGQFIRAEFRTVQKTKASSRGRLLEKQTRGRFRAGCDFANLKPVKDGIAAGTRGPVSELGYGVWENFPLTILHEGVRYYRFSVAMDAQGVPLIPTVDYFVDGVPSSKEDWLSHQAPSAANKKASLVFNVREDHLLWEAE